MRNSGSQTAGQLILSILTLSILTLSIFVLPVGCGKEESEKPVEKPEPTELGDKDLSQIKINKVEAGPSGKDFYVYFYNGSKWELKEITLEFELVSSNPKKHPSWKKNFRASVHIEPLSASMDSFTVSDADPETTKYLHQRIVGAMGFRK